MKIGVVVIHFIIIKMAQNIVEIVEHVATLKAMGNMIASAPKIKRNIVVKIVLNVEDNQTAHSAHPHRQTVALASTHCKEVVGRYM